MKPRKVSVTGCVMMDKRQFIKYQIRSRLPFYLLLIFNGIILVLFAFLFEEAADILHYALTILTFVAIIIVIWDLVSSYQSYNLAYLYEKMTPSSPLEFYLAQALENAKESQMVQTEEERKRYTDLMDYYTLWVHQIKTPIAASQLLLGDVTDSKTRALLELEVFKIDAYTNLVLQYLRLENFHDDLQLRQVALDPLVKEVVKKHSIFFIQKGLTISSSTSDIPYQYSGNIQMQFIKDEGYDNFSVIGFYRTNYFEKTQLLEIDENGVFSLNKDAFQKDGLLNLSFLLVSELKEVHLGVVSFIVRSTIGNGNDILPEERKEWIKIVRSEVDGYLKSIDLDDKFDIMQDKDLENIWNEIFN